MQYDVAILGYGPVGATAACLLRGHGLRVLVVEQAAGIYDKPRAITADHEVMRVMQFAGISDELGPHVRPHPGTEYLGVDGKPILFIKSAPPPYPLGWPTGVHFVQPEFEGMLRAAVARSGDIEVLLEHQAVDVSGRGHDVELRLRDLSSGQLRVLHARYLLACDGANSFVRKQLQIPYEDLAFDEWWIVVDAWLRRPAALPETSIQYCRPSRPGTIVIGPRNLRRWELKILPHENPDDFRDDKRVLAALADFVDTDAIDLWRIAVYRFHALIASRWREGRIFLLGDAVHQTPPFLGQGMCAGIRDVSNLVWKLLLVEKHGADPRIFDSYEQERKPHVREVVALAKERGLIIGELNVEAALERDAKLRAQVARGEIETMRHLSIPPLGAGLIDVDDAGHPTRGAGHLFVQPRVRTADGRALLMDDLLPPAFLVVSARMAPQLWIEAEDIGALRRLGAMRVVIGAFDEPADEMAGEGITVLTEENTLFLDWMKAHNAEIVLVRPDRYVYGMASTAKEFRCLLRGLSDNVFPTDGARRNPKPAI